MPWQCCGVDHNLANKQRASAAGALRLISRNALASGSARLMIDAQCCSTTYRLTANIFLAVLT
jgi:hypothetical protein